MDAMRSTYHRNVCLLLAIALYFFLGGPSNDLRERSSPWVLLTMASVLRRAAFVVDRKALVWKSGCRSVDSRCILCDTSVIYFEHIRLNHRNAYNFTPFIPSAKLMTGWKPGSSKPIRSFDEIMSGISLGAVGSWRPVQRAHGYSGHWHPHFTVLKI